MGVEQVMVDAFSRAKDYENAIKKKPTELRQKSTATANPFLTVRRDLELDALVEIMNKKGLLPAILCAKQITSTMRIAERFASG
jgi:hypothetical protein